MDPKDFLSLAEELCKRDQPAACRSAVSRAYYAAFVSACRFVGRECHIPDNAEAHGILPRLLTNSGNDDLRDVADHLHKLRAYRNEADYTMGSARAEKKAHAETCVKLARQVIVDLVAIINDRTKWNQAVIEMKRTEAAIKKI